MKNSSIGVASLISYLSGMLLNIALVVIVLLAILFFGAWLWTVLLEPAEDVQRIRESVALANGDVMSVDYPRRLLIEDSPTQFYLTINTERPVSATLEIPPSLPLILVSAVPSDSVTLDGILGSKLVVSWPITASQTITTGPIQRKPLTNRIIAITPTLPVFISQQTISLLFDNARTERGWPFVSTGFSKTPIAFNSTSSPHIIEIEVETTDRANWRHFAREYSFLAIAPLFIAIVGGLGKMQIDRRKRREARAEAELENLKALVGSVTLGQSIRERRTVVGRQFRILEQYRAFLNQEDWNRIEKLTRLHQCEFAEVRPEISNDDFSHWADVAAGALSTMAFSFAELPMPLQQHQSENQTAIRRWLRTFPRDLLSIPAEKRLHEATNQIVVLPIQPLDWPIPPTPPKDYQKLAGNDLTLQRLRLFPDQDAATKVEQSYLFSRSTRWFWAQHPLYEEISSHDRHVLVKGATGVGRTALAMALSQYSDRTHRVLSAYAVGPADLTDLQRILAQGLLDFARKRTDFLAVFEREERELLARLLLCVLDTNVVLANLASRDSQDVANGLQNDEQASVFSEQSLLELRLLRQSVKSATSSPQMSFAQWFMGVRHCAKRLEFRQICTALDMTTEQWMVWQDSVLPRLIKLSHDNHDLPPLRIVATVTQNDVPVTCRYKDFDSRDLVWVDENGASLLQPMLEHRALARGIPHGLLPTVFPALTTLCRRARDNPRCLAALWESIEEEFSDKDTITEEMIERTRGQQDADSSCRA